MPIHDWTRVRAGVFHDFHQEWTLCMKHALNRGVLPPGYYAMVEQASGGRYPDVFNFQVDRSSAKHDAGPKPLNGGVLTLAEAPPQVGITASIEADVYAKKSNRVVVIDDVQEVVAVIDVISPGNKSSRRALQSFVEKALQFIRKGIHLLIVDLFPPTSRDREGIHAAIWSEMTDYDFHLPDGKPRTLASYSCGAVIRAFVEPVHVGGALPMMPLFLDVESYVQVPLESTYQIAFDEVPKPWRSDCCI